MRVENVAMKSHTNMLIRHPKMLEKSRNARNVEQFYKLANIESNREWAQSANGELREIRSVKVEPWSEAVKHAFKSGIMQFKP